MRPHSAAAYRAAGIPDHDIPAWQAARITAPRARGYTTHHITPDEAIALRERGIYSAHHHWCGSVLGQMRREAEAAQTAA